LFRGYEAALVSGHHLILGELTDLITGETLSDTLDERYRQRLARLLLEKREYRKTDIEPRRALTVQAGEHRAVVPVDFVIRISGRIAMIVKYGPGSLVTRHRPLLALTRLLAPYQVPLGVVTNGEDADLLDGESGGLIGSGLEAVPGRGTLEAMVAGARFSPISAKRAEMEARIVYCYEVDGACPCDDTVCRL